MAALKRAVMLGRRRGKVGQSRLHRFVLHIDWLVVWYTEINQLHQSALTSLIG